MDSMAGGYESRSGPDHSAKVRAGIEAARARAEAQGREVAKRPGTVTNTQREAIAALRDKGMTVAQIMEATGLSQSSVYRALRKLGKV
jgi:DNA invertase Pin-like site-specific DNA recombinase